MDALALSKKIRINPQELNTLIDVAGVVFSQLGMLKLGLYGTRLELKSKAREIELLVLYKNETAWNSGLASVFRARVKEEFPALDVSVAGYCIKISINSEESKELFDSVKAKIVWIWEI